MNLDQPLTLTTRSCSASRKVQRPDLIVSLCCCLLFILVLGSRGLTPVLAADDAPILQKLEEMNIRLEKAEANQLATERSLIAFKECVQQAVKAPPEYSQVLKDKARKALIDRLPFSLGKLCVVGNIKCQIDGVSANVGDVRKSQELVAFGTVELLVELARTSEQQMQGLASRVDACVK